MSIFGSIMGKIFGGGPHAPPVTAAPVQPASVPQAPAGAAPTVDVEAILIGFAAKRPEALDWRSSIVDLMKLLDLDSSLAARRELAKELKYDGDMNDSAAMNIWLHKQVMRQFAANGGKVPAAFRS